ncbi:MAG TPA: hypothetical protein PKZ28_08995, partial [Piscinibacter sp.]|nr:hypothetical protein [Piscinibacter sp.]
RRCWRSEPSLFAPKSNGPREEAPGRVVVGFLDPQTMVGLVGKPDVKPVADEAERRLRRACAALAGAKN